MCFGNLKGEAPTLGIDQPVRKVSINSTGSGGNINGFTNGIGESGYQKPTPSSKRQKADQDPIHYESNFGRTSSHAFSNTHDPIDRHKGIGETLQPYRSNSTSDNAGDKFASFDIPAHSDRTNDPTHSSNLKSESQREAQSKTDPTAFQHSASPPPPFQNDDKSTSSTTTDKNPKKKSRFPWSKYEPTEEDLRLKAKYAVTPEEARAKVMQMSAGLDGPGAGTAGFFGGGTIF